MIALQAVTALVAVAAVSFGSRMPRGSGSGCGTRLHMLMQAACLKSQLASTLNGGHLPLGLWSTALIIIMVIKSNNTKNIIGVTIVITVVAVECSWVRRLETARSPWSKRTD